MSSETYNSLAPECWNACLELIGGPVESLDAVQRPAALVFEYYGRVMNGGHSLHFDVHGDSREPELVEALKEIGAARHARILEETYFLSREAKRNRSEDYAAEMIEDLDLEFGRLKPDIPELLGRYFMSHPESFPVKAEQLAKTRELKWPEFVTGPEKLRAYYARIAAKNTRDPQWANGVQVCDSWLELQRKEVITQADIDALLDRMRAEPKSGSGWSIMLDQFRCWAKEKGFAA